MPTNMTEAAGFPYHRCALVGQGPSLEASIEVSMLVSSSQHHVASKGWMLS